MLKTPIAASLAALAVAGAGAAAAQDPDREIVVREAAGAAFRFIDEAPRAPSGGEGQSRYSLGDQLVSNQPLSGDAGTLHLTCAATKSGARIDKVLFSCRAVADLEDGDIVAEGLVSLGAPRSVLAVTGGTRDFAGAGGTLERAGAERATLTYRLNG